MIDHERHVARATYPTRHRARRGQQRPGAADGTLRARHELCQPKVEQDLVRVRIRIRVRVRVRIRVGVGVRIRVGVGVRARVGGRARARVRDRADQPAVSGGEPNVVWLEVTMHDAHPRDGT
eukprot:scaffold13239_cov69-Phaeocystis_antarctica.AAC.5